MIDSSGQTSDISISDNVHQQEQTKQSIENAEKDHHVNDYSEKSLSNYILNQRKNNLKNNKKKYRMVALDLDGTLLNSNHKISEKSVEYLRYLHSTVGVRVILASGRAPQTMYEHVLKLNLTPYDGEEHGIPIVSYNGALGLYVKPSKTSPLGVDVKEIFHTAVPKDVTIRCIQLAKRLNHVVQYYYNENIYANPTDKHHYELCDHYMELTGCQTIFVNDSNGDKGDNNNQNDDFYLLLSQDQIPSKILVMCDKSDQDDMMNAFENEIGLDATIIRGSYGWFLEVLHPKVNKGHGLQELCNNLKDDNISVSETITFGDGDNDYEFIKNSGLGVAMSNARNCIKNVASIITNYDHDNDGVIHTLKQMEQQQQDNDDAFF